MKRPCRWPLIPIGLVGALLVVPPSWQPRLWHAPRTDTARLRQDPGEQEPPPLKLEWAWSVTARKEGEERINDLRDSVLFSQGDQYILSDNATFLLDSEKATLWGNVQGWDPIWRFWADRVVYLGKERFLTATGNVRALKEEDGTLLRALELQYDRNTGEGLATGEPYLYQPPGDSGASATEVIGGPDARLTFHRDAGWAEIEGHSVVHRGDVTVEGEWMRTEDEPRILIVRDNVEFRKEGVRATGDSLNWDETAGFARLNGSPPMLYRVSEREEGSSDSVFVTMTADSIDLTMKDEILETILLHGPGTVNIRTTPAPGKMRLRADSTRVPAVPERMVLDGNDITITLDESELRRLEASRAAMYYWREDTPDRQSAMGGLDLQVEFEGGEPSIVTAIGNATTRFYQDVDVEDAGIQRALAALIRLTLEDGDLKVAHLEDGNAWQYSAEMVFAGRVPMAVHPDSIQVGAGRRPQGAERPTTGPPGAPPPPPAISPDRSESHHGGSS
jgi:lipopolysaccharide export system protein LptA